MESDPQYVIRRFESGRYAIDPSVRNVYHRALELTGVSSGLCMWTGVDVSSGVEFRNVKPVNPVFSSKISHVQLSLCRYVVQHVHYV